MHVEVRVLGDFVVTVDGVGIPAAAWRHRPAVALVQLLALAPGARLHREQVIDALWPDLSVDEAAPRLHKAAHFARRTLGRPDAVVLRGDVVALFPEAAVTIDAVTFEDLARAALSAPAEQRAASCAAAIDRYGGELLPATPYAAWCTARRARLAGRQLELLRVVGRWDDVLALEATDEQAHLELLRAAVAAGDRAGALRRFEAMDEALREGLGVGAGSEATMLRDRALWLAPASLAETAATARRPPRVAVDQPLLERDRQLGQLGDAVADAVDGRGSVVVVSGEAGSGKTALVRRFIDEAPPAVDVVLGGCDDLLTSRSLGPLRDMATMHPEIAAALASTRPDDLFGALLTAVAAHPTVVVVEDVQWADDATLDVIRYLARRIGSLRSVLVLTCRDDEATASEPLGRILGGLPARVVRRVLLEPLTVDAVAELAATSSTALDPDDVRRVSQGNAFFVTEILAAGTAGVPPTVRDATLGRLSRLRPATRALVERLAVVPNRAERWLAVELAGGDTDLPIDAERSGVIVGDPTHVAFRHELAREAIEASLTEGERVAANGAVVDALAGHGDGDAARLVHHAMHAGRIDLLAVHGPAAADEAVRVGAHRQAADLLRMVVEHDPSLSDVDTARLLDQRAYSLYVVNEFDAAYECASRAVAAARRVGDVALLSRSLLTLSRAALFAVGPSRARRAAHEAVELREAAGDVPGLVLALTDLARAHSNLATVGVVPEPGAATREHAARALALCARDGRDEMRAHALCYLGEGRVADGDERGFVDLAQAIAASSREARAEQRVRIYVNAAGSAHRAGRLDDALQLVATGLQLASDSDFFAGEYRLRLTAAAVLVTRGDWSPAIGELRTLIADERGPGLMRLLGASVLGRVLARQDDPGARRVLDDAIAHPRAHGDSYVLGPLVAAQLELCWLRGTAAAPAALDQVLDLAATAGHRSAHTELCALARRAGHDVAAPPEPTGPWADELAGDWRRAAAQWGRLGERYERNVLRALHGDRRTRADALADLDALGATAAVRRLADDAPRRRPRP